MSTPHIYSNESADKSEKLLDEKKDKELQFQIEDLISMKKSPYFAELEVTFDNGERKAAKFGKYSLPQADIYSWIAPIARLRFKNCGVCTYKTPEKDINQAMLHSKSNFSVINGEIKFMSYENEEISKTLVHQESIPEHTADFRLKEIIVQMEEYQDSIIRLDPREPILISGPAGSGKTTLALHRVAYLMQSPENEEYFPNKTALILLQDESTKTYFENLLPELGIRHFRSQTYTQFLRSILQIPNNVKIVSRFGTTKKEKALLEHYKYLALVDIDEEVTSTAYLYLLHTIYKEYLPKSSLELFKQQKRDAVLDRLDLDILAKILLRPRPENSKKRSKRKRYYPDYELIVIDEAENYLKEEIAVIKKSLKQNRRSIIYTGDLVQSSRAYALKKWDDVGEDFDNERKIQLPKVYRTTRQILEFIKSLGYNVEIDEKLKSGLEVTTHITDSIEEEIQLIQDSRFMTHDSNIGILAPTQNYLKPFEQFQSSNIQVLTFEEAQGVEFDKVIIIGLDDSLFLKLSEYPGFEDVVREQNNIMRNLLYVALTRARKKLLILSREKIHEIIHV